MHLRFWSSAVVICIAHLHGTLASQASWSSPARVSTVYQFPEPPSWLENLSQRSNGLVLATQINPANLYQFDPSQPSTQTPTLITNVPNVNALLGITEYAPDVFAVIAGNFTLTNGQSNPSQAGSYSIVSVDLNKSPVTTTTLAVFRQAEFLNGMTLVPPSATAPMGILLASDSQLGAVWSLNIATKQTALAAKDPLMLPCPGTPVLGINGIQYDPASNRAYFSNSWCGFIASISIDPSTGESIGAATRVGSQSQSFPFVDDFALTLDGNAAFFAHANYDQIGAENLIHGVVSVVAGKVNTTEIAEPTAVWIGRTAADKAKGRLYVTTAGGLASPINGTIMVGGQLLAIDMGKWTAWM